MRRTALGRLSPGQEAPFAFAEGAFFVYLLKANGVVGHRDMLTWARDLTAVKHDGVGRRVKSPTVGSIVGNWQLIDSHFHHRRKPQR